MTKYEAMGTSYGAIRRRSLLLFVLLLLAAGRTDSLQARADAPKSTSFFLRDGDTVVFYGDSITEQQNYGRDIETYVLARYPHLHVKCINSGWNGDRTIVSGGGPIDVRLKRDVANYKPTVVTICLGMNDAGYTPYTDKLFQTYVKGLTHIVDQVAQTNPGVRITLLTPPFFDYAAKERPTPPMPPFNYKNPDPNYNQTLIRYGDFVRQLGAQRGIPVADTNAPMASAVAEGRKTDPKFALSLDGVHPNEMGHVIMAAAVLKTWNAPPPIHGAVMPWPLPPSAKAVFRVSSLASLLEGKTDPALEAKSQTVLSLVQQRIDAWHQFWKGGWANKVSFVKRNDIPTDDEMAALVAKNNEMDVLRSQAYEAAQP